MLSAWVVAVLAIPLFYISLLPEWLGGLVAPAIFIGGTLWSLATPLVKGTWRPWR